MSIIRDGRNVVIGAPVVRADVSIAHPPPEPTPSQVLGTMTRHLKGVLTSVEDLRILLEKQEKE
jgi:hypothetical protein